MQPVVATLALVAALTLPSALAAQAPAVAESPWHIVPGFHAGTPATVSVTIALARSIDRRRDGWQDAFIAVEPGLAAGRLSAGYARFEGNLATGYTVRATALRRWRNRSANYVGVEGSLHALFLGPRVGVFIPLARGDGDRVMLTIDVTLGY